MFGLFPKKVDAQALMKFYDIDGDGNITYEEFIRGLRNPLSERRLKIVRSAFAQMDRDGSGEITIKDIDQIYDVSQNADFLTGKMSREEILMSFLDGFDGAKGNNDGKISMQEWTDYYTDLSMSLPSEEYFIKMMESVWGMCEDEGETVTKE